MDKVEIKDISGNLLLATSIGEGSKRKFLLMKEDYITLKFSLEEPIYFKLGDYIEDPRFGLFEICDLQKPAYNTSTGGYDYELRFDAHYWKWKNKIFKFTPEAAGQEASWNLTAPLDVQLGVFLRNLKALGYAYGGKDFEFSIDGSVENKAQLMSYDNANLIDALSRMAETWECEWWVNGNQICFGRCEQGDPVDLEVGVNVKEMTRSDSQSAYATRIYAFGSTRNIPSNYRPVDESVVVNGVVQKRLMLPVGTPYIDAYPNMRTEEAVEQVVVFDDVYPRRTGTMSDITTHEYTDKIEEEGKEPVYKKWNAYRFKDTGIMFSKDYVLEGQELRIIFQSGSLNGMEFAVTFNPCDKEGGETPVPEKNSDGSWNPPAQVWEIVRNEDYGRELPGDVMVPKNGDTYVLSGFDTKFVSDAMIPDAENELKERAQKYIAKSKVDPSTYENRMMPDSIYSEDGLYKLLDVGDRVNLINRAYFENGRQSRIIGFEYNLDIPYDHPVYTVGETASYSRLGELEGRLESLTLAGQACTGGGGSGVYVIGTNDSTPATNRNVFSALRSLAVFLRKDIAESVKYLMTFLGGVVIRKFARFGEFITGVSGGLIDEDGNLEMESGVFRKRLFVPEIAYNRITYFKGRMVNSPGGGCSVKEWKDNGDGTYTVTPDLTDADGLSQFVDDILTTYFVTKNAEGKLNGFEEMKFRVTAADYSRKVFTLMPRPGYGWKPADQMVLAQTGNFTDPERQTYILIDSVNGNNCITYFDSANTWDPEPAQMPAWFGKKKGMTVAGIDCDNYSAVLQNILMTGLIFQIDEITGSKVRVPLDKGEWKAGRYAYYDRVSHNGSLWLCVNEKGTSSEPSAANPDWLKQVSEGKPGEPGDKGDPGLSVVGGGHWESSKTPYAANTMVSFANSVFLSKVETSHPPIAIARFKNGAFRRKRDGGYILAGKSADWQVHPDWEILLDGRELKGESFNFLGEFASHPVNPENGDTYRNTTDHCTYTYKDGIWKVMLEDGTDGKDAKDYEWIYQRTNIIGLPPEKPESKQQDDYVPSGWTDDFLGVDQDHQVEWACKRTKRDGVWSEFSTPAVVHRWSKDGESVIGADLDNEMASAALDSAGVTTAAQSWTTHASLWYGTEKLPLETLTVNVPAGFTASTSKSTGAVAISVAAGKSLAGQNIVTITVGSAKNGQLYTRELTFRIAGIRGGADGSDAVLYSLVPSASSVKKDKNGNYSVASVSCKRMKTVGAVTTATTDGELKYSRDGAAEVSIGDNVGVASGNFSKSLKFVYYVVGQVVDVETVPMLIDGGDGKPGADGESIVSAGHWESAKTPYKANRVVEFAGGSYLSKVETSNPPIRIARFKNGNYRRKRDGGYILAGRSATRSVHPDWQQMVSPSDPSISYWLDSPVSTINFTSTGTPSPSAFLVTCKQNVAGNVSTCNTLYLAARKYNGSWLAHVGATQSSQISVPATAGYTQFAVRAYRSVSDANAWNDNYVAEKGIGVAVDGKPGDKGDTGATGAFPRDRGVFGTSDGLGAYVWSPSYRDKVIHMFNGVYHNFLVRNYGASVTAAPTSANGDSNWEAMQKFVNIATDTLFADGANIAGFLFARRAGQNAGILQSQKMINGQPATSIDGETGDIVTQSLHVRGDSTFDGYIKNSCVEAYLSRNTRKGTGTYTVDKDFKLFSCSLKACSAGIYGETFILPSDPSFVGTVVNITNLCFPPYSRAYGSIRNTVVSRPGGSFQNDNVIHGYESSADDIYSVRDITTIEFLNGYIELLGIPAYSTTDGSIAGCEWMIRQFKAASHSVVYAG